MNTTETNCSIRKKQGQPPTLGARAGIPSPGRCQGWHRRLRQWCASCLPKRRRHRAPPRLGNVWEAHHKQMQQSAAADSLDRLARERPSLLTTIYTSLWR